VPKNLQEIVSERVDMVSQFVTEEILDAAEKITIADLLECKASIAETLSLLSNVSRFNFLYEKDEEDVQLLKDVFSLHNSFPRSANGIAYDVINSIKQARRESTDQGLLFGKNIAPEVVQRTSPKILPAKPQAQPFTPEKARSSVERFLQAKVKADEQTFPFEECCKAVQHSYLDYGRSRWHDLDLVEVNNQTPKWKQSVSAALGFFSDKETVSFVHRRNLWMIIPL